MGKRKGGAKRTKRSRWMLDYETRDRLLRSLGFASYREYLASAPWAEIRDKVLRRDRWTCRLCSGNASQVHHTSYDLDSLAGRNLSLLAAICGGCHLFVEYDKNGKKRTAAEVGRAYKMARRRRKAILWAEETSPLTAEFRAIVRG